MYKINFEKIKQSSTDFKGKDWFTPGEIITGVYWNISDIPLEHVQYIPKDKYKHFPVVYIDESIRDHMTQILFILKEKFTDTELGFAGWKPFSKESLIIYQTLSPHDLTLNELIKNKSEELLQNELIIRKKNKLPPFIRLIAIIVSSKDHRLSFNGAREIKMKLSQINGLEILGPVDSPLLKVKKNFRSRLLIRFSNQTLMQKKI